MIFNLTEILKFLTLGLLPPYIMVQSYSLLQATTIHCNASTAKAA